MSHNDEVQRTQKKDIRGRRFGMLTVIRPSHQNKDTRWVWECICDCGNIKLALKNNLDFKHTTHCGCLTPQKRIEAGRTHGLKYTRIYSIWAGIKDRCLNDNNDAYSYYGGRGIKICDRWAESVTSFLEDMGEPGEYLQIDRIDNDGDYEPSNCRWVTSKTQAQNRRTSKIWFIKGLVFNSSIDAGAHFNVSDVTIRRWCDGGDRTIPKEDCYWRMKYAQQ